MSDKGVIRGYDGITNDNYATEDRRKEKTLTVAMKNDGKIDRALQKTEPPWLESAYLKIG